MATFREFEQDSWEDVEVCAAYGDRFGGVVAQAIGPVLDAVSVGPRGDVLDVRPAPAPSPPLPPGSGPRR